MREVLGLLFLAILLSQGIAPLVPLGADDCSDDGCTPMTCSQTCPTCVCTLDRDRIAPQAFSARTALEPLHAAPITGDLIPPVSFPQEILKVPKAPHA